MPELEGPVLVVGAGLLGTSIGLALRRAGVDVALSDLNMEHARTAKSLGASNVTLDAVDARLVVVAVPPAALADEIASALWAPHSFVTDVGSVKAGPLATVAGLVGREDLERYVGGHPMAGSERSGPLAASAALFDGRPWAVTPHATSSPAATAMVTALAETCGGVPVTFSPDEHDLAVATTSHLPHLLAALVAGRLAQAPPNHLALSGQGVRDVTRIAAGDPSLWLQIVTANSGALTDLLTAVRDDVDKLLAALKAGDDDGLTALLARGVAGATAIPAKHGGPARDDAVLYVAVPDHPGELARLFADAGEIGVNIEDVRIDHDPGREVGLLELTVAATAIDHLQESLSARGWTTHR
jgi:prephenate dehydrogenase